MKWAVLLVVWALAGGGLAIVLVRQLRYAVTARHLQVRLFGFCVRRIPFSEIVRVSKRQTRRAEKWCNTLRGSHRMLVIRRRRGWFRDFIITPKNRYVFKAELEAAMARWRSQGEGSQGFGDPPEASPEA
jgi:hypothetical protein